MGIAASKGGDDTQLINTYAQRHNIKEPFTINLDYKTCSTASDICNAINEEYKLFTVDNSKLDAAAGRIKYYVKYLCHIPTDKVGDDKLTAIYNLSDVIKNNEDSNREVITQINLRIPEYTKLVTKNWFHRNMHKIVIGSTVALAVGTALIPGVDVATAGLAAGEIAAEGAITATAAEGAVAAAATETAVAETAATAATETAITATAAEGAVAETAANIAPQTVQQLVTSNIKNLAIAQGVTELTKLTIQDAVGQITSKINSTNQIVADKTKPIEDRTTALINMTNQLNYDLCVVAKQDSDPAHDDKLTKILGAVVKLNNIRNSIKQGKQLEPQQINDALAIAKQIANESMTYSLSHSPVTGAGPQYSTYNLLVAFLVVVVAILCIYIFYIIYDIKQSTLTNRRA